MGARSTISGGCAQTVRPRCSERMDPRSLVNHQEKDWTLQTMVARIIPVLLSDENPGTKVISRSGYNGSTMDVRTLLDWQKRLVTKVSHALCAHCNMERKQCSVQDPMDHSRPPGSTNGKIQD